MLATTGVARSQAIVPPGTPQHWVQQAAAAEQSIIENDGSFPLRYRMRKRDGKGDITRDVIESRQGTVARLVARNGQTLTRDEDTAEQQRLNDILRSPDDFIRHHRKDDSARSYATDLVKLLPTAMRLAYTPGQPQFPGATAPQVVIDFEPDPGFKPPTLVSELLTGVAGRFWIDEKTGRMTRVEARVIHPVNFGFGVLARIHEGGTVEFEQAQIGPDRWAYTHMEEHLSVRELMFKTVPEDATMTSFDFQLLPAPVSFQDAVHTLLATPVATR